MTACCRQIAVCGQSLLKNHGENEKICVGAHPTGAAAAAAATSWLRQPPCHYARQADVIMGDVNESPDGVAENLVCEAENNSDDDDQLPDPNDDYVEDAIDDDDMGELTTNSPHVEGAFGTEIIKLKLILDQHPASIKLYNSSMRFLPIHLALKHNSRVTESIRVFFQLYPQSAAMPNGKGRLPIHIAFLHNSPSWELVLDLAPSTLEKKDTTLGLLPFQTVIASLSSSDKRKLISSLMALQDIELFKDEEEKLS